MDWFRKLVCHFFHRGGEVARDDQGRINWRCLKCGRWSDHPVGHEKELEVLDGVMALRKQEMQGRLCHCGATARVTLDGDDLCQHHADQWVKSEGYAARAHQH